MFKKIGNRFRRIFKRRSPSPKRNTARSPSPKRNTAVSLTNMPNAIRLAIMHKLSPTNLFSMYQVSTSNKKLINSDPILFQRIKEAKTKQLITKYNNAVRNINRLTTQTAITYNIPELQKIRKELRKAGVNANQRMRELKMHFHIMNKPGSEQPFRIHARHMNSTYPNIAEAARRLGR